MKNKDRLTRSLCAVLSATVLLMNFQCYQVRAEEKSIRYYSVMDNRDFEVVANVTSVWEHHANVDFEINNVGQEKIDNWYITFNTPYIVEQVWNGTIFDQDGKGNYTLKNDVWNQDIMPGESAVFSMTLYSEDTEIVDLPVWYLLNTKVVELPLDRLSIEYTEYTRWEEGFSGAVQILTDSIIEDWAITINSEYELVGVEGAELTPNDDGTFTLKNTDSSQNLSTLSPNLFSVIGIPTENDFSIDVVKVESVTVAYMLEEDRDENAIPDYIDYINSIDGESKVVPSPTPTIDIEPTIYPEPTEEVIVEPTSKPEPTVADSADWVDTDGDGIDDYLEISIGYNPLQGDSDGNGILDGYEDFDGDGITNKTEIEEGICIFAPDSDYDGIDDYSELFMYGSDPDSDDSNDDGIKDGNAVKLGFDPSKSDSDGDGIPDCEEKQYQEYKLDIPENADLKAVTEVEIKGEFTNLLSSTTTIEDTWGKDVYSSAIDALVGGLVSIETTSDFDSATLVFHYDENALGDIDEEDLCILWHDEGNGKYVMFDKEQVLDKENNTLSLETTHFCSMMVIDKSAWIDTWKKNLDRYLKSREEYESTHSSGGTKYIFAVQLSGTDSREFRIKQYDAYVKLLSQFSDEDIGGVLVYSGYARGYQGYSVSWYQGFIAYNMFANMDSGETDITQAFSVASDIQSIVAEESDPVVLYVFTSQTTDISLSADDIANINRNGKYTVNIVSVDGLVQSDLSTGGITARVVPCSDPDAFVDLAVE